MHPDFATLMSRVHELYSKLVSMQPVARTSVPRDRKVRGVYLFSEGDEHFYVGRTNNLRQRLGNHCNDSSQHNQAVFAFKLARHRTGFIKAQYAGEGRRAMLVEGEEFLEAFRDSKARVRKMELRYVEVEDQLTQALLEIYVASVLKTPFNDFDTH
jgi:hypothetical protein